MELHRSHTNRQFRYLRGDQTIDSENIGVLLLENVKEQKKKRITNCQREHDWVGKTEQDIVLRYI